MTISIINNKLSPISGQIMLMMSMFIRTGIRMDETPIYQHVALLDHGTISRTKRRLG